MTNDSPRFAIYIRDQDIRKNLREMNNKSEYVERAIRFYEDNKDIVKKLSDELFKRM